MTEPPLNRSGIVPLVRKRIAATMSKHVRMRLDAEAGRRGYPLEHPREAGCRERRAALGNKHEWRGLALALEAPQRAQLVALDRMRARHAVLDATRVQNRPAKVDLVPAQVDELAVHQARRHAVRHPIEAVIGEQIVARTQTHPGYLRGTPHSGASPIENGSGRATNEVSNRRRADIFRKP
jgi:hypothetical protein